MAKTAFSELRAIPFLRRRMDRLRTALSENPEAVVPWVGAGMSVRYGMPLWSSFLCELIEKMPEEDRSTAEHLRKVGFYDLLADFAHMRLRDEFATLMVRSFSRNINTTVLHPIARIHPRMVVTTNYDRVLDLTMPWLLPLLPNTFNLNAFRGEDVVLKLHGTIETPTSWVLTRFQYATAYREILWNELHHLFANQTVLFVGCSLINDMFLDVLREVPRERRPAHYAILNVSSDEEAESRGKELSRLGISVLPYITDDEDHRIVERIVDFVRPKGKMVLTYAETLRRSGKLDRAMRVLDVEADATGDVLGRTRVAAQMADVLQAYRHERSERAITDLVVRFARKAATLGSTSETVIAEAIETLRLAGQSYDDLKETLRQLRKPEASGSVSSTRDMDIQEAYRLLRTGHMAELLQQLKRVEGRLAKAERFRLDFAPRLGILRLRAFLALGDNDRAKAAVDALSDAARPFGEALIAFSHDAPTETLASLDVLERRWRASSDLEHRSGLAFSLSLRTLAHLALSDYRGAAASASQAVAAHDPNARKAARLFRRGIASELCYDIRRLGSSELRTILQCHDWMSRATLRGDTDEDDLKALRGLVRQLECEKSADRLLRWYWVLFAQLLPDSAPQQLELQRTFDELLRETRDESMGILGEVVLLFRTATHTAFRDSIQTAHLAALGL